LSEADKVEGMVSRERAQMAPQQKAATGGLASLPLAIRARAAFGSGPQLAFGYRQQRREEAMAIKCRRLFFCSSLRGHHRCEERRRERFEI